MDQDEMIKDIYSDSKNAHFDIVPKGNILYITMRGKFTDNDFKEFFQAVRKGAMKVEKINNTFKCFTNTVDLEPHNGFGTAVLVDTQQMLRTLGCKKSAKIVTKKGHVLWADVVRSMAKYPYEEKLFSLEYKDKALKWLNEESDSILHMYY